MKPEIKNESAQLEKIKKAYDSPTWWYDIRGFFILKLAYQDSLFKQIRFFAENTSGNHLEVAIGTGTLAQIIYYYDRYILRKKEWIGYGFDYSDAMLDGAIQKFKGIYFKIILADVCHLPFENKSFDTINLANAIHCFPDVATALKELTRVLSDEGRLYINVILNSKENNLFGKIARSLMVWGMKKGILFKPYEPDEISELIIRAGLQIFQVNRNGNSLNIIAGVSKN